MRFIPIKDFLAYIEKCHLSLADLYLRLSQEANDEKVKLLLDFIIKKEQLSYQHLNEYIQQGSQSILETWLDNNYDQSIPLNCEEIKGQPDLMIADVVALIMTFDTQLIELLQNAAHNSPTIEAELALENLSDQEEETLHQVIMASNEFEYI